MSKGCFSNCLLYHWRGATTVASKCFYKLLEREKQTKKGTGRKIKLETNICSSSLKKHNCIESVTVTNIDFFFKFGPINWLYSYSCSGIFLCNIKQIVALGKTWKKTKTKNEQYHLFKLPSISSWWKRFSIPWSRLTVTNHCNFVMSAAIVFPGEG